jgi:hypothetical protein
MLIDTQVHYKDPYVHNFEIKDGDVRTLNMKRNPVPENNLVLEVHQIFSNEVDETTEEVVAIPTKQCTTEDIKSEKFFIHYKLGHLPFAAIN